MEEDAALLLLRPRLFVVVLFCPLPFSAGRPSIVICFRLGELAVVDLWRRLVDVSLLLVVEVDLLLPLEVEPSAASSEVDIAPVVALSVSDIFSSDGVLFFEVVRRDSDDCVWFVELELGGNCSGGGEAMVAVFSSIIGRVRM